MNTLQKSLFALFAAFMSMFVSTTALAHPGHDHSAPTSMLVHVLFYGSIVAVVAAALYLGYRYLQNKDIKK